MSSDDGRTPAAIAAPPTTAIIAPLSVQSPGLGRRSLMPAAAVRSSSSDRSREFAATPPPISRSPIPSASHAAIAFAVSTSQTASWNEAATSSIENASPSRRRVSTQRATAVLRPENEKSKRCLARSFVAVRPRGNAIARGLPCAAALSMIGPPGYARPSRRATLSYASPAASSMVEPSSWTPVAMSSTRSSDVWPPDTSSAIAGARQRSVVEDVDGDVADEVVDAVQRLVQRHGESLRGREADDERRHQARARR